MKKIAIIPARGGSKRIPRKNIKLFHGKPIIAYSIEVAIKSNLFDEVMVSTDDAEIQKIALEYGAKVPFLRSAKNSDSNATTLEVIQEVIQEYEKINLKFDFTCCIYPTAPFVNIESLRNGFNLLNSKNVPTCFPIVQFTHPIYRGFIKVGDELLKIFPHHFDQRTQDFDKTFHDAGQWYWINNSFELDSLINENSATIELSNMMVQDLDNFIDWELASMKFNILNHE